MNTNRISGKVWLVGAGPGDPELLTLKAARVLGNADVVLVDDLVDKRILAHVRPAARIVEVGKRGGCRSTPQAFIEKLMVRLARRGATVVRLKGGDPFVFGRGGEEAETLAKAGISCEVVSGITAGIAVPATIGIPVTHRDCARSVTFLTGHARDDSSPNWAALRAGNTTLVIYMGMTRVTAIVNDMIKGGYPPDTPACAIQNGTLDTQATVVSTLAALPQQIAEAGLGSPGMLVIGEVVRQARTQAIPSRQQAA
ncbi:MAG: uroporphyrinogen-III C-methyltransferase [Burkholderiales bacterium]|nr:uroporphyrinogen-III C-methyltransferase [Burkholderiales bacterium]